MSRIEDAMEDIGRPIVVATHPRSGTHLTIDLLRKQFEECVGWLWFGETLHHLYLSLDRLIPGHTPSLSVEEALGLLRRAPRPTVKTHSTPDLENHENEGRRLGELLLERGDILYVVRDGRDVLCSAYRWRQAAELDCSLQEFLRREVNGVSRVRRWADHISAWVQHDEVEVIRFEDIVERPRRTIEQLGEILGLSPKLVEPYLPDKIENGSRWADYWRRLTRDFESTAITGRPDGKAPPEWRDAFREEDRRFFWKEAGHILKQLGYEEDDSWVRSPSP